MWSKILDTSLAIEARLLIEKNELAGCKYHNWDHIVSMYQYLENINEPYDPLLDWAVLFHDVVYDGADNKELRSALLFKNMARNPKSGRDLTFDEITEVGLMICDTRDHYIYPEKSRRYQALIEADLVGLTDVLTTTQNFVKILEESIIIYNAPILKCAKASINFLHDFRDRIKENRTICNSDKIEFYDRVIDGIDLTLHYNISIVKVSCKNV